MKGSQQEVCLLTKEASEVKCHLPPLTQKVLKNQPRAGRLRQTAELRVEDEEETARHYRLVTR